MKKYTIIFLGLLISNSLFAQRPKLYLKAFAGTNTHIFVYKDLEKSRDVIQGWQGGFGFRVTQKKFVGEIDFIFLRNSVIVPLPDSVASEEFNKFEFKLHSFDLPLKVGVVPIKTPLFKWYCYSGASFRFNTKGILKINDQELKFKPKEVGLANPNIDFILGSQVDIGWLNIDLMYGIGVTNSLRQNIRTNSQQLQINVGMLF